MGLARWVTESFDQYENDTNHLLLNFPSQDLHPVGDGGDSSSTVIKAPNQGRIFWKNDIPSFHQSPSDFSEVFSHVSFGQILQKLSQDRCCCSFSNKTQQETLPFSCFRATAHALCGLGEGAPCMPEAAQTTPIH